MGTLPLFEGINQRQEFIAQVNAPEPPQDVALIHAETCVVGAEQSMDKIHSRLPARPQRSMPAITTPSAPWFKAPGLDRRIEHTYPHLQKTLDFRGMAS